MLRFVCFALLASFISASITFKDCGNAEVKSIGVSGCSSSPCTLHNVTINVTFVANQDTEKAEIAVFSKIGQRQIAVLGIDTDGCNGHLTCPLKKGETYTINIPTIAPKIGADVTVKLVGDNGILACGTLHGSIKALDATAMVKNTHLFRFKRQYCSSRCSNPSTCHYYCPACPC
jgi:hypothetical protein